MKSINYGWHQRFRELYDKALVKYSNEHRKVETFFTKLNGEGWIFDRPSHVYVVPADGLGAPRNLTPGPFQHTGVAWLPDSSAIATSAQRHETWDRDFAADLYLVPVGDGRGDSGEDDGGEIRDLTKQRGQYSFPSVSADGATIAFIFSSARRETKASV